MFPFITRRVLRGLIALLLFQTLLFTIIYLVPSDFGSFVGAGASGRAFVRSQLGLDLPLWQQYLNWLTRFVQFDLGVSFMYNPVTVLEIIQTRAPRTLLLFFSAALLAYLLGIWLGKVIAWRRGSRLEGLVTLGGVAGYTSFAPWLAFLAVNMFAWHLGWFPYEKLIDFNVWLGSPFTLDEVLTRMVVTGAVLLGIGSLLPRMIRRKWIRMLILFLLSGIAVGLWYLGGFANLALDILYHLVLPLGTVVLLSFGETMMIMRTSMLETMGEDYVVTARAKGLSETAIRDRHVARNAILPVLTRTALNLPVILIGSLIIERAFFWRGMGIAIFDAIEFLDIPVLLGTLSLIGILAVFIHILVDILYVYLDPRIRNLAET